MRRCAAVLVILAAGCRAQSVDTQMWRHYERAGAVQAAMLEGDLGSARATARWIAEHPAHGVPGEPVAWTDSMRLAARAVTNAPDLAEAAQATSRMAATCGSCHVAARRGPTYAATSDPPRASGTDIGQQMTLHQWALGKMWDGLTGPSNESWARGASALAEAPGYQRHIARGGVAPVAADSLAGRLTALSLAAGSAAGPDRARVFGQMLQACTGCHERFRVRVPRQTQTN